VRYRRLSAILVHYESNQIEQHRHASLFRCELLCCSRSPLLLTLYLIDPVRRRRPSSNWRGPTFSSFH
jgi:hypothetical protein